jgi:hypothetical protein
MRMCRRQWRHDVMRMNPFKLGLASLLLVSACTGFPFFGKKSSSPPGREAIKDATIGNQVPSRVILEVQDIQYDGFTISARVLVSPEGGPLRLDRRLIPTIHVDMGIIADCTRGSVLAMRADLIARRARPEDLLVLEPGYWYGSTVRFNPFDEHFTGIGPECVEATIRLLSFDRKIVARQRIRAVRPPSMDGGTQEDGGLQEDGGTGFFANPPGSR